MRRADSRSATDVRELGLTTSLLSRADGSAKFACGPVSVLASVAGPIEVKVRDEIVDRATLEINTRPFRGLPGPASKSFSTSLSHILSPILLLNRHPRSLIQLSLQTLSLPSTKFSKPFRTFSDLSNGDPQSDDYSLSTRESLSEKAAMINAAICALMDAGIDMKGMICAVSIAIVQASPQVVDQDRNGEIDTPMSSESILILDPSAEEERDAMASFCIGFSFGQDVGGTEGDMCFLEMGSGGCEEEILLQAIDLARLAAQAILNFIRKSQELQYLPPESNNHSKSKPE